MPSSEKIPKIKLATPNKYTKEASNYVTKHFPNNYGNTDLPYPITHKDAKKWLKTFISKRLNKFGTYQDAMVEGEPFLFHSVISPMLNIGLLMPSQVLKELAKVKSKIKMNNYEGFIRQLVGWREYQRYTYYFAYSKIKNFNYFGNKNKLSKRLYTGTTDILPLDDAIKTAFDYGYLHHINRLMVISNMFNLLGIHPDEAYKWFMEFSVDSYDYLMIQNVYSMGQWSDGGLTMRKPYISSDNYISNMSNYESGEWKNIWNALYYNFLQKHDKKLKKTPYSRNLVHWKNKSKAEQKEIIRIARQTIKKLTN